MFIFSFSSSPPGVSCCPPFQLELFSFLLVLFSPVSRIPVMCLNCGFHVIQTAGWFLQVGFFKSPKVFFSTVCFSLDLFFFCPICLVWAYSSVLRGSADFLPCLPASPVCWKNSISRCRTPVLLCCVT